MDDRHLQQRMEQALVTVTLCVATLVTCMGLLVLGPDAGETSPLLSGQSRAGVNYGTQKPGGEPPGECNYHCGMKAAVSRQGT
jgi:hypothetical protein